MQQLMKSMREATLASGMLDNSGTQLGTEMLDTQFATKMTGLPGGLSRGDRAPARAADGRRVAGHAAAPPRSRGCAASRPTRSPTRRGQFVQQHSNAARAAEAATGIPAAFMVAQAAHESGWGQREIRNADGSAVAQPVRHQGRRALEGRGRRGHDHRSTSTARRAR